jgi:4-amino-4-deoxy-L-arabinose transferase-like glycosyltransferase
LEDSGRIYLIYAFNLAHLNTFSLNWDEPIEPSSYRELLYSWLLAAGIAVDPILRRMPPQEFFTGWNTAHERVRVLLAIQVALALMTALLAATIVWHLTRSLLPAMATLFCVGLSPGLLHYVHGYMPELLAALFMTLTSALLLHTVERRHPLSYAAAGISFGLMTLTRAIFQYALPIVALFLVWSHWRERTKRSAVVRGTTLFVLGYFVVVAPWMARNYAHFGRATISERSGVVLYTRAEFATMNRYEYLASFLYWTPGASGLLTRLFAPKHYARFDETNREGFLLHARFRRTIWERLHGGNTLAADVVLKREALQRIASHPFRYLAVTLPIAWRGILVEEFLTPLVSPILFGSFFWLAARAARHRDAKLLALVLTGLCSYATYTLGSENRFRFNAPLLPLTWICLILLLSQRAGGARGDASLSTSQEARG